MSSAKMQKLTGIQKDVLKLYRLCVRAAYKKEPDTRPQFLRYIQSEFDKYRDLNRRDISTIEYLLRTGHRRLEMLSNPSIRTIH